MQQSNSQESALSRTKRALLAIAEDGGRTNAVAEIDPTCLDMARALDAMPPEGRGALFGEPILLKDNIDMAGTVHTTAGSLALAGRVAGRDAFIASRLRKAGAVLIGKSNMTEFANFVSPEMPNGYSARGGQVVSPTGNDPGGSSSGSGAAVGAGLVRMAVGTETLGSILSPSQSCGCVGLKPTAGLVSRAGILPLSTTLDTAGPIAATVREAARLLTALAGYDPEDTATHVLADRPAEQYEAALDAGALHGARIGVSRSTEPSQSYRAVFERLCARMKRMGAELVEIEAPPLDSSVVSAIFFGEFRAALDLFLQTRGGAGDIRSLKDIVRYNLLHADAAPWGQSLLEKALKDDGRRAGAEYLRALAAREDLREAACERFRKHSLNAVVCAAGWSQYAPIAGLPYATIPTGDFYKSGEPAGCALIAPPFAEGRLLSLLYALEGDIAREKAAAAR